MSPSPGRLAQGFRGEAPEGGLGLGVPASCGGFRVPLRAFGFRAPRIYGGFRVCLGAVGFRASRVYGGFRVPLGAFGFRASRVYGGFRIPLLNAFGFRASSVLWAPSDLTPKTASPKHRQARELPALPGRHLLCHPWIALLWGCRPQPWPKGLMGLGLRA